MHKFLLYFIFTLILVCYSPASNTEPAAVTVSSECEQLFSSMGLEGTVSYKAFEQAYEGYTKIEGIKKHIVTLIDFSKPSTEKRLYVLDMEHRRMLFSSHVAHGRNSGDNFATSFSNKEGSFKSSLGFYLTENTYQGRNGYSLVLNGLEKGINDKAKERAIVIHGAAYCNPNFIGSAGRLGRSFGCPALPEALNAVIINTIKEGSLLYIYADDHDYLAQSPILSNRRMASL